MKTPVKSIVAAASLALAGGGTYLATQEKPQPSKLADPHAWLTEPAVWIQDPQIVWLQTADLGTVNAGPVEAVVKNYPQFKPQITAAVVEYNERQIAAGKNWVLDPYNDQFPQYNWNWE